MDYYKILGIETNASKEKIKEGYDLQVEKIKGEVTNEKTLKPFLKLFNEAYEALINEKEIEEKLGEKHSYINKEKIINEDSYYNETVVIDPVEIEYEIEKQKLSEQESDNGISKNSFIKNKSKRKSSSNTSKRKELSKKNVPIDKESGIESQKTKKNPSRKKENNQNPAKWISLPLKLLALPLIAILSVIILLCKLINIVSWIASKIIIVGGIAVVAIHLYQIKLGQAPNYKILILGGIGIIASFFLPYILSVVPKIISKLNNKLKNFVFNI